MKSKRIQWPEHVERAGKQMRTFWWPDLAVRPFEMQAQGWEDYTVNKRLSK